MTRPRSAAIAAPISAPCPATSSRASAAPAARDCVMMLDEIDKLGRGIQGDPASALLEVLDPEQNSTFRDNYLGVPFDLSRVMFITHRERARHHPGPAARPHGGHRPAGLHRGREVRDRPALSRRAPAQRQRAQRPSRPRSPTRRSHAIIRDYTREAGVRKLEREIGTALRSAAMQIAEGSAQHVRIDAGRPARDPRAAPLRGRGRDAHQHPRRRDRARLDAGRRRHPVHRGDPHARQGRPDPDRPARRGDEGERAGGAVAWSRAARVGLGLDPKLFEKSDIHIHVPAGAIPKDGPSAGVAMFTALVSLLTGRTVRSDTAMTGEISLRGLVLPVGGIKEKVIAAARAGLSTVILPARNRKDYEDIPEARAQRAALRLGRAGRGRHRGRARSSPGSDTGARFGSRVGPYRPTACG